MTLEEWEAQQQGEPCISAVYSAFSLHPSLLSFEGEGASGMMKKRPG